jgi:hypothetical protein
VLFEHRGWAEPVEFMNHCSTKRAVFLLSLKQLLETGHGSPDPDYVPISDCTDRQRAMTTNTPAGLRDIHGCRVACRW